MRSKRNGSRRIRQLRLGGELWVRVQRYQCCSCKRSFTLRRHPRRRYSQGFEFEVARRHVEGRGSYRVIAQWVHQQYGRKLSASSLQRIVETVAQRCKTPSEMSGELRSRWEGILSLDEKMARVRGKQQWWYHAVDRTGDIVDCRAVAELMVNEAMRFLEGLRALRLKLKGIVTDLDTVLTLAVEKVYPEIPHQYCIKHALAALEGLMGYQPLAQRQRWNRLILRRQFERLPGRKGLWRERAQEEFLRSWEVTRALSQRYRLLHGLWEECRAILTAKTEPMALEQLKGLARARRFPSEEHRKVVAFFRRHWNRLTMHHRVKSLPRTNNQAENLNKQLQRRFKTIEAFQHRATAVTYMNLLIAYLRQKPYTDCRGARKHLNGKCRLEAAGVRLPSRHWLLNALRPPQNSNR